MIERQGCLKLPDKRGGAAFLISLFLILVGSRAALISHAGNATPFLDEWDGDAAYLLEPYLQGRLTVGDLLAPFGEHRILFTRLLVLTIFNVSGYWDVILQMIVNAIVNAAAVVAFSYALARVLGGAFAVAAMIVCVAINAVPYGYDAILFGFHTQFFFLNAFSFASLWLLAGSKAWSPRWAAGVLAALAAYLSMASGAFTPGAAAAAHLLQAACGRRRGLRETLGMAALGAMTVAMLALNSAPPGVRRLQSAFPWAVSLRIFATCELACPQRAGVDPLRAIGAIRDAHARGTPWAQRSALAEPRCARLGPEPDCRACVRSSGSIGPDALYPHPAGRVDDQSRKRPLVVPVGRDRGQAGADVAVARPCGVARKSSRCG